MGRAIGLVVGLAIAGALGAAPPPVDPEGRLKGLADELRCLVCQNQTIGDSNAPLANDLKREIRTMIAAGRTDEEIRAMVVGSSTLGKEERRIVDEVFDAGERSLREVMVLAILPRIGAGFRY